ncbi:hypothetical protein B0H10DRAFT_1960212 [Mycena sp. CBHHK59/15]|nr:hypothetical protein B0H10DRAFT_1960212 [Mycena sp. CBHHK59/15]
MEEGCAQNADGSLRDASEIQWYNGAADEHPISGPSSSSASTSATPLHPIFTNGVRPLDKVGGVRRSSPRRSSRTSKPSARAVDPNNAEVRPNSGKRKASPAGRQPRKKAQVIQSESSGGESDAESVRDGSEPAADPETEGENTESASGMDVDEYEKFKAMGDADHAHATAKTSRTDSTADVRTVFKRVECERNRHTGAVVRKAGAICLVCTRKGLKPDVRFLTGSVSTLRSHIVRHDDHFQVYQARSEKLNIEMHPRAIPDTNSSTGNEIQATLDGVVVAQPRPTVFTSEGLRDFLIEMIVTQDEAIDVFVRLADDSDEVPDLRDKQYRNYMLTKQEWTKIEEPADVTQTFSSERTPTVWRIIPTLEFLIKRWETMSTQPKFAEIEDTLLEGVKSLKKWFHRAETTSGAYFICLVLNPGIKDVYFHAHWGDEEYKAGMEAFEEAVLFHGLLLSLSCS